MPRSVVVTGVGCVSPNGIGCTAFTDALLAGRSGLSFLNHDVRGTLKSTIAGQLQAFNAAEHMDAQDVRRTPRTVHLAIAAAREALAQADVDPARTGVLLGTGGGGVVFLEDQYRAHFTGGKTSPFAITVGTHGNLASELSITFGLRGPSHCVSTGCASGLDAVGHGLDLIRNGRCDAVLCGGADAPIANGTLRAFEALKVISTRTFANPADACRPFAADRDGFVLAEGAWMFLLEAADATNRPALSEIAGYGSTCDAYHRVQVAPDVAECVRAVRLALEDARCKTDDVDYVNLHGTGTRMNDELETRAMRQLFGHRADAIPMSATKSMIGHPQGAGATAGLAATILCAQRGMIHPTINITPADPACDLNYVAEVRRAQVRTAVINCLAFGSKNSALTVRLNG